MNKLTYLISHKQIIRLTAYIHTEIIQAYVFNTLYFSLHWTCVIAMFKYNYIHQRISLKSFSNLFSTIQIINSIAIPPQNNIKDCKLPKCACKIKRITKDFLCSRFTIRSLFNLLLYYFISYRIN